MKRIAIVGASLAGLNALRSLRKFGFDGEITVIGAESHMPYDRPPLSKQILTGEMGSESLSLDPGEADASWLLGEPATGVNFDKRVVATNNYDVPFDGLIITTGVRPRQLPSVAADHKTIFTLRNIEDSLALKSVLERKPRVLIVGAGFIGVEVATSARALGCEVVLIGNLPPLAPAGSIASWTAENLLRDIGVSVKIGPMISSISPVAGVAKLSDGSEVTFDVAVVAVGSVPNVEWLSETTLDLSDGILCDRDSRVVGVGNVTTAGDVARWPAPFSPGRPVRIEHWSNAVDQGRLAAATLLGKTDESRIVPSFWSDHCGVRLQSVGSLAEVDDFELVEGDISKGQYALAARRDGRLVGGLAYRLPRAVANLRSALVESDSEGKVTG